MQLDLNTVKGGKNPNVLLSVRHKAIMGLGEGVGVWRTAVEIAFEAKILDPASLLEVLSLLHWLPLKEG